MVYTQFKACYMVKLPKIPAASDHFPLLARQQGSPGLNLSIYWGNRAHHVFPKHSKNAKKKITLFRRQITLFRRQITPFQKSQKTDQCSQSLVILQLFHLIIFRSPVSHIRNLWGKHVFMGIAPTIQEEAPGIETSLNKSLPHPTRLLNNRSEASFQWFQPMV